MDSIFKRRTLLDTVAGGGFGGCSSVLVMLEWGSSMSVANWTGYHCRTP